MDGKRGGIRGAHHAITQREVVLDEVFELVKAQVRPIERRKELHVREAPRGHVRRRKRPRTTKEISLKVVVASRAGLVGDFDRFDLFRNELDLLAAETLRESAPLVLRGVEHVDLDVADPGHE